MRTARASVNATLKEGNCLRSTIIDFVKSLARGGRTFNELLEQPGIEPDGYGVELYPSEQKVQCLARLAES